MEQSATPVVRFSGLASLPVAASFDGGRLTSDGGLPWLEQAEQQLGVCQRLAEQVPEWRRGPVRHPLPTLIRQRVFQIASGYADQNDATSLRRDPLLKAVCGRLPETGGDLASQPTLSGWRTRWIGPVATGWRWRSARSICGNANGTGAQRGF